MLHDNFPAIVAGGFALAGVVISGMVALIGFRVKARHDLLSTVQTQHFERRLAAYERAFDSTIAIFHSGTTLPTLDDFRAINRDLILVGSPEVLRAWNRISDVSAEKLRSAGKTQAQVSAKQTAAVRAVFKAIRQDLYPGQRELDDADIRFIEPKTLAP